MAKSRKPNDRPKRPGKKTPLPPPPPIDGPPPDPNDPANAPLSDDEETFVQEYLVDRCAAAAYRRSFPDCSYRDAYRLGSAMRQRPHVLREIRAAISVQKTRSVVRADRVLDELGFIAHSDVLELFDPHTHELRHPRHIPFDVRRSIASIKVQRQRNSRTRNGSTSTRVTDSIVEYRLWNKNDALGKLMSHLGMTNELPPLELLLNSLPTELAAQVRAALSAPRVASPQPSTNGKH